MKLHDTLHQTYGNFTLDTSKINCNHSISEKNIEMPYNGPLPEQFAETSNPRIYFNVQATQGAKVLLLAEKSDGKKVRASIEASEDEIKNILRRFFYREDDKTRFDCGLIPYWLGTWAAHFREWDQIRYSAWNIIDRLTISERAVLLKELQRAEPATA